MQNIIKSSFVLGAILGLCSGLLLLIPFIAPLIFILLFLIISVAIIIYLKKNAFIGLLSVQDGAIIGTISGFISIVAASMIYIPGLYLINLFVGNVATKNFNLSDFLSMASYNLTIIVMIVFFIALLGALFNAFTGMVAAYIYEKMEDNPGASFQDHFNLEESD